MSEKLITEFKCIVENISLHIQNFKMVSTSEVFKTALIYESKEQAIKPMLATFRSISSINQPCIFSTGKICSGILEADILPSITNNNLFSQIYLMCLVEKIRENIVYRSRECCLIHEQDSDICSFCLQLREVIEKSNSFEEENVKERFRQHLESSIKRDWPDEKHTDAFSPLIKIEEEFDSRSSDREDYDIGFEKSKHNQKNLLKKIKQVSCQYCAETLSSKKKYVRHCQKYHPDEALLELENEENLRITLKEKKHNCPTCSKKFTSQKWLILHRIKVHNIK